MEKRGVFIKLRLTEITVILLVKSVSFLSHAEPKNLSENVNRNLKDTQWKMDYEREVRTVDALPKGPVPKGTKQKPPAASSFGVMTHEENPHFDTRESYSPREKEKIGGNLGSWAESTVRETQKTQRKNRARKDAWMKILNENAKNQGYKVVMDEATQQLYVVPSKELMSSPSKKQEQRVPGSQPNIVPGGF